MMRGVTKRVFRLTGTPNPPTEDRAEEGEPDEAGAAEDSASQGEGPEPGESTS